MHLVDTIAITLAGLMVGNELAVSAFINPAVWQLELGPQKQALSIFARSLGGAMPFWYGLCLAFFALGSFLHRHDANFGLLLTATLIWTGVIVLTILILVPINNRIGSLDTVAQTQDWKKDHKKWDSLHRGRILLLAVALFLFTYALVA